MTFEVVDYLQLPKAQIYVVVLAEQFRLHIFVPAACCYAINVRAG